MGCAADGGELERAAGLPFVKGCAQAGASRHQPGKYQARRNCHGNSLLSAQVVKFLLLPGWKLDAQQVLPAACQGPAPSCFSAM